MAAHGRDDDEPFLSRWSQRKRQAEEKAREAEAAEASEAEPAAGPEEIDLAELPDIDSLDATSDYTLFMRKGVPNSLKQRALRRLWHVDPAFRHICMLDDYNQDFTDAAMVVPNLKTLYQVGRGMVQPEEELVAEEAAARPAEPLPAGDSTAAALRDDDSTDDDSTQEPVPLASPEPADAPGQEEGRPRPEALEARPIADPAESLHDAEIASIRGSFFAGSRSARRRRWGDVEG